ncbi:hypothetical protein VPH35_032535 [Triticum aestivum]
MAYHLSSVFRGLRALFQGSSTAGQLASAPEESTAGQLAPVPEESTTAHLPPMPEESTSGFTDAFGQPPNSYRESIRSVCVVRPEWRIRSSLSDQSRSTYSSDSGALRSITSGYSNSASVGSSDLGISELTKIAHRMGSEGYTQRMVHAFHSASLTESFGLDPALRNWFVELDVDWILKPLQFQLQFSSFFSGYWLQEVVERWIRALIIIVASIDEELVTAGSGAPAATQFVTTSVSTMLIFVDAIVQVHRKENLQAMLQMCMCVRSASYAMLTMHATSSDAQEIFNKIGSTLESKENRLIESICETMEQLRRTTLMKDVNSWGTEILQGGDVHKTTRLMVGYITLMRKAIASTQRNSARSHNTEKLQELIDYTIDYLNSFLGCLFLLNNSYFVAQQVVPGHHGGLKLTPECDKYMDNYLDVSWGHVLSCISQSKIPGLLHPFDKTYQAQKFWKVPDPSLQSLLRETITKIVISVYSDYLKEHPELEKDVSGGSNSPKVLEEMLGELFEG